LADGASPNLPSDLQRELAISGEVDAFIADNRFWSITKADSRSVIRFKTKPDPKREIYIFKDEKVRGRVSNIDVSFHLAEETIAVATAFRGIGDRDEQTDEVILDVSIYMRRDELDPLFRYCHYLAPEKPELLVGVGLDCHQDAVERFAAERWYSQTFLIEEDVTAPVELRSVFWGRAFKKRAPVPGLRPSELDANDGPMTQRPSESSEGLVSRMDHDVGIRADLSVIYKQLTAMQFSLNWFSSIVEWSAIIAITLLGLILWRVW
jgi:hypothetical protein